jgi:hypothetical protein
MIYFNIYSNEREKKIFRYSFLSFSTIVNSFLLYYHKTSVRENVMEYKDNVSAVKFSVI